MITVNDVLNLRETARRQRSIMLAQIRLYEQAYTLDYVDDGRLVGNDDTTIAGQRFPAGTPVHIPSTGPALVDRFIEQLHIERWRVKSGKILRGRDVAERRRKLEAFGDYVMRRIDDSEDKNTWSDTVFSLALCGSACIRVLYDANEMPEDEGERVSAWPFYVRPVHPANVFIPPNARWPYRWVIEEQRRYYGELREEYPSWLPNSRTDKRGWRDDDEVEVTVYWDAKEYVLLAAGVEVVRQANTLGVAPYVFDYSGFGHQSMDNDPATESIGLLHHVMSELGAEVRLRTMADALWQQSVWPTLIGTLTEEEFRTKWSAGAGRYIAVSDMTKEKPDWLAPVPLNPNMFAMLPQLRESIEHATYAASLGGFSTPAVRSASQAGAYIGQARARLDRVRAAIQRMAGRAVAIVGRYVETMYDGGMRVGDMTVNAADIAGHDRFQVEFLDVDPADDQARQSMGLARLQANTISIVDFLRDFARDPDADATFERMLAEKVVLRLADQGAIDQAILENMGLLDRIAVAKQGLARGASQPNTTGGIDQLEQGAPYGARGEVAGGLPAGGGPAQYNPLEAQMPGGGMAA